MVAEMIHWTDHMGATHRLLSLEEIPPADMSNFVSLCRQFQYMHIILAAGQAAPALEQARPVLIAALLQKLIPAIGAETIAAIPIAEGEALLVRWCARQESLNPVPR
jgi:hypothetical protein